MIISTCEGVTLPWGKVGANEKRAQFALSRNDINLKAISSQ
jgi:hypothetical protein